MMLRIAIVCLYLVCVTGTGYALPVSGDIVKVAAGKYGRTSGGEFLITTKGQGGEHTFTTFCLEYNEYIGYRGHYFVDTVSEYATLGGGGAKNGRDQLSDASKWVYWNYLQGVYGFSDRVADNVQKTIWTLEEENWSRHNYIITNYKNSDFYKVVVNQSDYSIDGDVKVLNIVDGMGRHRQSQIIASVPEPSSILLLGSGLAGMALLGHRRKE